MKFPAFSFRSWAFLCFSIFKTEKRENPAPISSDRVAEIYAVGKLLWNVQQKGNELKKCTKGNPDLHICVHNCKAIRKLKYQCWVLTLWVFEGIVRVNPETLFCQWNAHYNQHCNSRGGFVRTTNWRLRFHFRWHLLFASTLLGLSRPMGRLDVCSVHMFKRSSPLWWLLFNPGLGRVRICKGVSLAMWTFFHERFPVIELSVIVVHVTKKLKQA